MLMSVPVGGGDPSLIKGAPSSSRRSMLSSEVVGAGVLTFSFTLHSCFVGMTEVLEPSRARWSSKPSSGLRLQKSDGPVWETRLSSFEVAAS
jgi:hypothetical protein